MKQFFSLLTLILFSQISFGQDTTYKYVYTFSLSNIKHTKSESRDSIPSIKTRFQISSRRELTDREIEIIKECIQGLKTQPSPSSFDLSPCAAKKEYYVEGLI